MVQEADLLNTEPFADASATGHVAVGFDTGDDDFYAFQTTQMTNLTVEDEVQSYLQDSDKSLASLKVHQTEP